MALTTPGLRALIAAGLKISSRASVAAARAFVGMLGSCLPARFQGKQGKVDGV
jgi:hypothetical protein